MSLARFRKGGLMDATDSNRDEPTVAIDFGPLAELFARSGDTGSLDEPAIAEEILRLSEDTAQQMATAYSTRRLDDWSRIRNARGGFEQRLTLNWGPALALYDLIHHLALDFGLQAHAEFAPRAHERSDLVFDVLISLHGRACLTASEVGALLRTGHASAAAARWRTANELATVAFFVSKHGQGVAQRYLDHEHVETFRDAEEYQVFAENSGYEPFSDEEMRGLRDEYEAVIGKYGRAFEDWFGWAADAVGKRRPGLGDLARNTDLADVAPYLRLANHGIHSGPKGAFWNLGSHPEVGGPVGGATAFGLADPGSHMLIALSQITIALLVHVLKADLISDDVEEGFFQGFLVNVQTRLILDLVRIAEEEFREIEAAGNSVPPRTFAYPSVWERPTFEAEEREATN